MFGSALLLAEQETQSRYYSLTGLELR